MTLASEKKNPQFQRGRCFKGTGRLPRERKGSKGIIRREPSAAKQGKSASRGWRERSLDTICGNAPGSKRPGRTGPLATGRCSLRYAPALTRLRTERTRSCRREYATRSTRLLAGTQLDSQLARGSTQLTRSCWRGYGVLKVRSRRRTRAVARVLTYVRLQLVYSWRTQQLPPAGRRRTQSLHRLSFPPGCFCFRVLCPGNGKPKGPRPLLGRSGATHVRPPGPLWAEAGGAQFPKAGARRRPGNSYLVDPASSHMLVSKIKPCMCKYKLFCTVKLRMAH